MVMVTSSYKAGTDDASSQITDLNKIVKNYDSSGVITGEAPMTKDLIEIANVDLYIHYLRKKLPGNCIRTIRGVGFCLQEDPDVSQATS